LLKVEIALRCSFSLQGTPFAKPNEIYNLNARYASDKDPNRVNLGVGAYKTDDGQPFIFSCVREAEKELLAANTNHEYLPIAGLASFYQAARDMLFHADFPATKEGRIVSVQSVR
jgi:aspartate/tyrosine/aromatic aminotransferase